MRSSSGLPAAGAPLPRRPGPVSSEKVRSIRPRSSAFGNGRASVLRSARTTPSSSLKSPAACPAARRSRPWWRSGPTRSGITSRSSSRWRRWRWTTCRSPGSRARWSCPRAWTASAADAVDSRAPGGGSSAPKRLQEGENAMNVQARKKPQVAVMNAVHDLPVLVARDKGFFKDEGLDLDFVTTPGMAQVTTSHLVKFDSVFNDGGIDQYRMCEWGIMKRAVEADTGGLRGRKIVALGASMSKFAIVVARESKYYEPEMLKDQAIAVTPNNGSHFTTLKIMEGFLAPEHIKTTHAGSMLKRLEAVRDGEVAAASLMEPWISVAQKRGMRILVESHSTRSEAAGDDLDGPTLKKMFRAQAHAVELIEKDPTPFVHYLVAETGGLLEAKDLQAWRLLHAPPQPYTRERFDDTYNWTVKWNMTVPGATFENTVDNRAWE